MLARAAFTHAARERVGTLITVNCPSLSAELLESEFFGHVRGAFTGAVQDTLGKVAAAEGGTLFLDEIGDLPLALQPKLLRLLQEKRYERVGETRTRACDVRILAATNRDLQGAVAAGTFREDLWYRLNVIEVVLPPLRGTGTATSRPWPNICYSFSPRQSGKPGCTFDEERGEALLKYPWPGNVRELRNATDGGVILAHGPQVKLSDLPVQVGAAAPVGITELGGAVTLDQLEAEHIRRVLAHTATMEEAAEQLGIDPSTLYRKRKRHGL